MTLNELMAVPYLDHGRDEHGLDCWGFVRLVRHLHHGFPLLDSFGTVDPDDKAGMTDAYHQLVGGYVETAPIDGAIACHLIENTLVHVGVVVNENGLKVAQTGRKMGRPWLCSLSDFERMSLITRYYIEHDCTSGLSQQAQS